MKEENLEGKLEELRNTFDGLYEEALTDIPFDNESISNALKAQMPLQLQWETLHKSTCRLHDRLEFLMDDAYSDSITEELRDSYKSVSISEAREFAKTNLEYKEFKKLLIEARSLRDEVKGVLEVVTSRKYALNNLSNVIISGVEDHIL